jgi:hypothetical protein
MASNAADDGKADDDEDDAAREEALEAGADST